jgi:ATP-dependent Lon protease
MERAQKEYYLNEKIKAIQKELGRGEKSEFDELRKKIEAAGMPKEVLDKAIQELKKLEAMPPMSAESTVSRNYIDWLLAVPWKKRSKETRSIDYAEKVLNTDHYGLEKIKERILEFLAVRQLVKNPRGSILCFAGLRALAKRRWACRSPRQPAASSFGFPWAACATRPRFAGTGVHTSARSPARSSST